jgi:hypothetical protein
MNADELGMEKARARQAMILWQGGGMGRMLLTWRRVTARANEEAFKAQGVLKRMLGSALGRSFNTWRDMSAECRRNAETMADARRKFVILLDGARAKAFFRWLALSTASAEGVTVLQQAARAFKSRAIKAAVNTWYENTAHQRELIRCGIRAISRWRHKRLFLAMYTWRASADSCLKQHHQMRRVVAVMRNATKARCLFTWSSIATERLLAQEVSRRAVVAYQNRALLRSFYQWQNSTDDDNRQDLENVRVTAFLKRIWTARKLRYFWNKWLDAGRQWLNLLIAYENITMRAKFRLWRSWTTFTVQRPHSDLAMRVKVLTRFRTSKAYVKGLSIALMFSHWKHTVSHGVSTQQSNELAQRAGTIALAGERCKAFWRMMDRARAQHAMEVWKYRLMMRWVKERAMMIPLADVDPGTTLMPWPGMGNSRR